MDNAKITEGEIDYKMCLLVTNILQADYVWAQNEKCNKYIQKTFSCCSAKNEVIEKLLDVSDGLSETLRTCLEQIKKIKLDFCNETNVSPCDKKFIHYEKRLREIFEKHNLPVQKIGIDLKCVCNLCICKICKEFLMSCMSAFESHEIAGPFVRYRENHTALENLQLKYFFMMSDEFVIKRFADIGNQVMDTLCHMYAARRHPPSGETKPSRSLCGNTMRSTIANRHSLGTIICSMINNREKHDYETIRIAVEPTKLTEHKIDEERTEETYTQILDNNDYIDFDTHVLREKSNQEVTIFDVTTPEHVQQTNLSNKITAPIKYFGIIIMKFIGETTILIKWNIEKIPNIQGYQIIIDGHLLHTTEVFSEGILIVKKLKKEKFIVELKPVR